MPHPSQAAQSPLNPVQVLHRAIATTRGTPIPVLHHYLTFVAPGESLPSTHAVDLTPDDHGSFLVTCSEFPEVRAFSETEEEALSLARQAIEDTLGAQRIRLAAFS